MFPCQIKAHRIDGSVIFVVTVGLRKDLMLSSGMLIFFSFPTNYFVDHHPLRIVGYGPNTPGDGGDANDASATQQPERETNDENRGHLKK